MPRINCCCISCKHNSYAGEFPVMVDTYGRCQLPEDVTIVLKPDRCGECDNDDVGFRCGTFEYKPEAYSPDGTVKYV